MATRVSYPAEDVAADRRLRLSLSTVVAFVAINVMLVAACALALRQIAKLRGQIAGAFSLLAPANGTVLPMLVGEDWTGDRQSVVYEQDQRPTLVYAFSQDCPHCQANWRAMRSLQALGPRLVRFTYIDTYGEKFTPQYLAESGIGQSVLFVKLRPESAVAYSARAVPQLVLVDHDGRVQWSHVGELAPSDVSQARALIDRH